MLLSLAHINTKAPYLVSEYEDGSVCFITDKGVEYWISFIEETNLGKFLLPLFHSYFQELRSKLDD